MGACLSCESGILSLTCGNLDLRRPLDATPLADFARRYAIARDHGDAPALLALGRDLRTWFDAGEDWLARLRDAITPPLDLEIRGPRNPDADTWAVLQAPWELLADEHGFLAEDATLRYAPARRLGAPTPPPPLDAYRLGIAFMAGAPIGVHELDFEAEEAAILDGADQSIDLFVEESGDPVQLGPRLVALNPPLPVLHLSCHGHNAWKGPDGTPQPVVMLEDQEGAQRPTSAEALIEALGTYKPRLIFVSANLSAAAGPAPGGTSRLADSLATGLIRQGVPAVLGWEGSVTDAAAVEFAHVLYRALGIRRLPLAHAAAAARRALLDGSTARRLPADPYILRRDWHLARVWPGPEGGGPVVGGQDERPFGSATSGSKILLAARGSEKLEVASRAMFVGRRRELQRALRELERFPIRLHCSPDE